MSTYNTSSSVAAARQRSGSRGRVSDGDTRYARRFDEIIQHATGVFCEKGYEGASMRDLSRATGMSLAGLYYYFESKEKLLYLIQKHTFSTIVESLHARLDAETDPEQRIRIFIRNHLEYFLANQKAMKVLSHEDEVLKDAFGDEVRAIKREYYRTCVSLVEDFWKCSAAENANAARGVKSSAARKVAAAPSARLAVLSLFGMMNWIYTWHNPRIDADAGALSQHMADIFLDGIRPADRDRRDSSPRNTKPISKRNS